MTSTTVTRHIDCDGAFNLRDLGGYCGADGRAVRWRTLFRADGLHRIEPEQRGTLDALGWQTVIDLRTPAEVDAGCFSCDGVAFVHLPILRDTWDAAALTAHEDDHVELLAARYLEMSEQGASAIAAAFELLASPARIPAVFHCSAGKDRTGVLAALLLAALGVDDDDIAHDYHRSAQAMNRLVSWITRDRPEIAEHMARQPAAFLACPPDAIVVFLDRLRERHGGIDWYLADIGLNRVTVESLRDTLLED